MSKKAQAAMEFLMTYGWAILVVLAAIGALAYFGVLRPDRFLPEKCTLPPGMACLDFTATSGQIQMVVQNGGGFVMSGIAIDLIYNNSNTIVNCSLGGGDLILTNGEKQTVSCPGTFDAGKLSGTVNVSYTNQDTGMTHTKAGELIAKVP